MIVTLDNGNTNFKADCDLEFDIKASQQGEDFEIDFRPVLKAYDFRFMGSDQSQTHEIKSFQITGMIRPNVPFEPKKLELDLTTGRLFIII